MDFQCYSISRPHPGRVRAIAKGSRVSHVERARIGDSALGRLKKLLRTISCSRSNYSRSEARRVSLCARRKWRGQIHSASVDLDRRGLERRPAQTLWLRFKKRKPFHASRDSPGDGLRSAKYPPHSRSLGSRQYRPIAFTRGTPGIDRRRPHAHERTARAPRSDFGSRPCSRLDFGR